MMPKKKLMKKHAFEETSYIQFIKIACDFLKETVLQ